MSDFEGDADSLTQEAPKLEDVEQQEVEEKPKPTPPKKIVGVGFGNIFDNGAISLRKSVIDPVDKTEDPSPTVKETPSASPLPVDSKNSSSSEIVRERALVLFAYKSEHEDELNLIEGEEVIVLQKEIEDPGWYRGEAHGKVGVFPDNFVRLIPNKPKKPPPPSREALARSSYLGGTPPPEGRSSPPPTTPKENASQPGTDAGSEETSSKPPPLPPKDVKTGKIGIGAIPNIGQIRSMLRTSITSPSDSAATPARSLFYISAPAPDGDPTVLIVPEPGSTVTTVLFHPTKERARPARKHDRRRVVKFDENSPTSSSESPVHSGIPANHHSAPISDSIDPISSSLPVTSSVSNSTRVQSLHIDTTAATPPVWEKRAMGGDPSNAVNSNQEKPPSVESSPVPAASPSGSTSVRRSPSNVVPPKKIPPAVPKKTIHQRSVDSAEPPSIPELPTAPSPKIGDRNASSVGISVPVKVDTVAHVNATPTVSPAVPPAVPIKPAAAIPPTAPTTEKPKEQHESCNAAIAAVNSRCDRLDKLVQDLRRDLTSAQNDVRRLTAELDDEKKLRLAAQVDLDRIRKNILSSTPSNGSSGPMVPSYPAPQPPVRPPPPADSSLPTTAI